MKRLCKAIKDRKYIIRRTKFPCSIQEEITEKGNYEKVGLKNQMY